MGVRVTEPFLKALRAWLKTINRGRRQEVKETTFARALLEYAVEHRVPWDEPDEAAAKVLFWDAVNAYVRACGGDTLGATTNGTRMMAVVAVEAALERLRGR